LLNRKQSVDQGMADSQEKTAFKFWVKAMKSRTLLNLAPSGVKNFVLKQVLKDTWSKRREPVKVAPKSFNQLWKERKK
ncbi:MAG: [Fe-S]-binding protein, partial [Hymenobacteraceae bacterium]|nr:[Fe-S]-binding protein [Hymenobacteraceae bacterium]